MTNRFTYFRESDLSNQGYYLLAQELAYQWLGSWVTPLWWSDAHLNKALAGFLAASAALEVRFYRLPRPNTIFVQNLRCLIFSSIHFHNSF